MRAGKRWLAAGLLACAVVVVLLSLTPSSDAAVTFLDGHFTVDFGDVPMCTGCLVDSGSIFDSIVERNPVILLTDAADRRLWLVSRLPSELA